MTATVFYVAEGGSTEEACRCIERVSRQHDWQLIVCEGLETVINRLQNRDDFSRETCLAVLGQQLGSPIRAARLLRQALPGIPLLFLAEQANERFVQQLRSPIAGIGKDWQVYSLSDPQFEERLHRTLEAITQKQKYKTTLRGLNRQLRNSRPSTISDVQRYTVSLHYLSHIVENAHDAIIAVTNAGVVVRWNQAAETLFGLSAAEVIGRSVFDLAEGEWPAQVRRYCNELTASGAPSSQHELQMSLVANRPITLEVTLSVVRDDQQNQIGLAMFLRDITERKITENVLADLRRDLERMSFEDGLTKVANRRMFDQRLSQEWYRSLRSGSPMSIIMIDIDYFKLYNDHYGHQAGDECLVAVASALQNTVRRSSDLVARYGGEEFVVLLPEVAEVDAIQVALQCCESVRQLGLTHVKSGLTGFVTISGGVSSMIPNSGESPQSLLIQADQMLYQAKQQGRNQIFHH